MKSKSLRQTNQTLMMDESSKPIRDTWIKSKILSNPADLTTMLICDLLAIVIGFRRWVSLMLKD